MIARRIGAGLVVLLLAVGIWRLARERRGDALIASDGYCTKRRATDGDCPSGHRCQPISDPLRDDLARLGAPDRLCVRRAP